jgi:hypothetical protein
MIEEYDRSGPSWRESTNDYQKLTEKIGLMTRATYEAVPAQQALTAEQQAAAQAAADETAKQIQAAKDLSDAVGVGLTGSIQKATDAEKATKESIEEATTALMDQTMMAGLTGQSQLDMARALGIMSEADYAAAVASKAIRKEFDANKLSAEQAAAKVKELSDWIAGMQSKNITVTTEFIEIHRNVQAGQVYNPAEVAAGKDLNGNGIIGAATGINMIVPPGFNRDNFLVGLSSGEEFNVKSSSRVGVSSGGNKGGNSYQFFATGITDPEAFLDWCGQRVKEQDGLLV